ncbi:MAG: hypothetical protein GX293_11850 [Bacteroidales bacterium]|jgi:hypothetical protein|nr:hypothetical protein [Bacteroidales bacterium]
MMGIMLEWNDGIRGILAFFPVVAISSNFSTRFLGIKGKKKKQEKQEFPCNIRVGYLPPSLPITIGTSPYRVKEPENSANIERKYKFQSPRRGSL